MSTEYPTGTPSPDELHRNLARFSGTGRYYRTHPDLLATDGTKYLADQAGAYWLLDMIHEGREPKTTYYQQQVAWTDFPLEAVKLYMQHSGGERVLMLSSEY